MANFNIFVIRAILGIVFSVVLLRFFRSDATILHGVGFGVLLVGLAYFFEFLKNRKS